MNDMISRQAAINALGEAPEVWTDSPEEFAALSQWEMDVTAIEALPSADAVEVVRCKDCKHSHMTYDGSCKYCDLWDEDGEALYLEGDFYCAWGERREDGEA